MTGKKSESIRTQAIEVFRTNGGIMKTSEAIAAGVRQEIIYELVLPAFEGRPGF